jgi:hypothetical protein
MNPKVREHRYRRLTEIGCIACSIEGTGVWSCGSLEIHHLNLGGKAGQKRRGDPFTIPLGKWHHQAQPPSGESTSSARVLYGPSLKYHSRAFREKYGSDDELLEKVNAEIVRRDRIAVGYLTEAEVSRG